MKISFWAVPLALVFCLTAASAAEKMDPKKPDAPAGTDGTWTGTLAAPSGQGIATLHVKAEKDKKDALKTLVLWAESDSLKSQIDAALKKHATVQISGSLAADNTNVKVASITVEEAKRKGKSK